MGGLRGFTRGWANKNSLASGGEGAGRSGGWAEAEEFEDEGGDGDALDLPVGWGGGGALIFADFDDVGQSVGPP
jgi:hypothetical protein